MIPSNYKSPAQFFQIWDNRRKRAIADPADDDYEYKGRVRYNQFESVLMEEMNI